MRKIKKIAVLGSGIMGSRIACHFANIGVEVLLLDITPSELNESEKKKNLTLKDSAVKNRIANDSLLNTLKTKPSPIYKKSFASYITIGNLEDDLQKIKDCDWILEAIIEKLDVKKELFEKIDQFKSEGTIISSNTSGIPINLIAEGRSEDFKSNFCGTHFFNPPRYLQLLEIIPTKKTSSELVSFLMSYGENFLGKTTVLCKDTPAFIANRIGIFSIMKVLDSMKKFNLTIDEIDTLTGPIIGRPKSATFRTSDLVGLDTLIKVSKNLYDTLKNDEAHQIFKIPDFVARMEEKNWLGDKTKQGFYKKTVNEKGERKILTLDLNTFEYKSKQKVRFGLLGKARKTENIKERYQILTNSNETVSEFYKDVFYSLFSYVSNKIPEISDDIYKIDDAMKTGFGWSLGPFEIWDTLGVENTLDDMQSYGIAPWVNTMVLNKFTSFYQTKKGIKQFYNCASQLYQDIPGQKQKITLTNLTKSNIVWNNSGCSLYDIGDGILNLEFHTKMNTMGSEVLQGIQQSISITEKDFSGLVIANEAQNFSAGANLAIILMYAAEQEFDEIDLMIQQFQNTTTRARFSSIPVVVAPRGLTLGGGCELTLHADYVQAAAETYIGLVEFGVGLIPAGGGTKELVLRVSDSIKQGDVELNNLYNAFLNIGTAKVATSAHEAKDLHILRKQDGISINLNLQISDAKRECLRLVRTNYTKPSIRKDVRAQGKTALSLFLTGIDGMLNGNYISKYDAKIATKLAYVMCGGDLSSPTNVSEQYFLDLEREAFLSLCGEQKTLQRIEHMLKTGKPLRN